VSRLRKFAQSNRLYVVFCILSFALYLLISVSKHAHFNSGGFDLGIFHQAVTNYSDFRAPASSIRGVDNLLGDHFHPILILATPLYWIHKSPATLLVLQAFLVALSSLPLYLFSRMRFNKLNSSLLSGLYLINPAIIRMILFDFHEIAFALPLIGLALYAIEKGRMKLALVSVAGLLLVKEDLALLVVFFGIYLVVKNRSLWKTAVMVSGVGLSYFLVVTKVIIPFFGSSKSYGYWTYTALGQDLPSALKFIILHPVDTLQLLFKPAAKVTTLAKHLGPVLFLPLFSPIIILTIPSFASRYLSDNSLYWDFNYHYGAVPAIILSFALADGLDRLKPWLKKHSYFTPGILGFCGMIMLVNLLTTPLVVSALKPSTFTQTDTELIGYAIIGRINPSRKVCTSNRISPHLKNKQIILLGLPGSEKIRMDCDSIILSSNLDASPELERDRNIISDGNFKQVISSSGWTLWEKN
jgi:uncharacterized membrane protein